MFTYAAVAAGVLLGPPVLYLWWRYVILPLITPTYHVKRPSRFKNCSTDVTVVYPFGLVRSWTLSNSGEGDANLGWVLQWGRNSTSMNASTWTIHHLEAASRGIGVRVVDHSDSAKSSTKPDKPKKPKRNWTRFLVRDKSRDHLKLVKS